MPKYSIFFVLIFCIVQVSHAYVDLAPTLGRIVNDSHHIALVEIEKFSREKGIVILRLLTIIKGKLANSSHRHQLLRAGESSLDPHILAWADIGSRAVLFISGDTALVCVGHGWYQVQKSPDDFWKLVVARPDLPLAYYGLVERLGTAVEQMVAGKTAVITTLPHGADWEGASFDLALNRSSLPGLVPVQRLKADLRMPAMVMAVSANPAYLVGSGANDADDVPRLMQGLRAADANCRAESAMELGSLGKSADTAAEELSKLLSDESPKARLQAAAALLRLEMHQSTAIQILTTGLSDESVSVRRLAAQATALAGHEAAPLCKLLAKLLGDNDEALVRAALSAIATLGTAASDDAIVPALVPLLEVPSTAIDAADALGRIGPRAQGALPALAKQLSSADVRQQWAAVRAMSQIGGDGAKPAVDYMIEKLKTRPAEVEGYNMMIYLALLGPAAKDAIPAIEGVWIKNPVLKSATLWAIEPEKRLPWQVSGPFGMPVRDADFARYIYESYIDELGDRLRPAARLWANKVLQGEAGEMPRWAYTLLAKYADDVLPLLTATLESPELKQRQRATVALGYLGSAAKPAAKSLSAVLEKIPTDGTASQEQERRLIQWALRQQNL